MPASIGFRVYQVTAQRKNARTVLSIRDGDLLTTVPTFLSDFVAGNSTAVTSTATERSWYFEPRDRDADGNTRGVIHYGTYGFESNLVSTKTKKTNYRRKVDDVEEIPLFYEFWCPDDIDFGFLAFQSFQGRSCIAIVMASLQERFEAANPGFSIRFHKVLPSDGRGSLFRTAPVKRLKLIRRNAGSDITDRYLSNSDADGVDIEITLTARRNQSLGMFGGLDKALKRTSGVVLHDGIKFTEAVAEINVGGKLRRVGVFGSESEAGVIDLTESVVRGADGHPTYASLVDLSNDILSDFHDVLSVA